jgi:glycine/D-amino acid oxidase-like deaminating enzyme
MTANITSPRVVIVGGGISGLSIGARLCQASYKVTLLESSQLGVGASTRNQGWLYSGAWFAPQSIELAKACYQSLVQTLEFCPDCVEPNHTGMCYLLADGASFSDGWTKAWAKAGIPFEALETESVRAKIPHWDPKKIQFAWRLPDRAVRVDVLLSHLATTAENLGMEIRTGTIAGVTTASGEELSADLVILATGGEPSLRSEVSGEVAGDQPSYQFVNLKTHLIAIEPGLCPEPFCVLDHGGFNHIPHSSTSVFGSNHWSTVSRFHDVSVEVAEVQRIVHHLTALLPTWDYPPSRIVKWAGTTVQAMHLDQIEPGRVTLPTVIDHEAEPGRVKNLLSVFAGRASLWPQLAEMAFTDVERKLGRKAVGVAKPPWVDGG